MNTKITEVKSYVVYLPLNQHTSLKILAAKRNITIASIFKDLIDSFLKKEEGGVN